MSTFKLASASFLLLMLCGCGNSNWTPPRPSTKTDFSHKTLNPKYDVVTEIKESTTNYSPNNHKPDVKDFEGNKTIQDQMNRRRHNQILQQQRRGK